jgi:hypothetical protein
MFKRIALPFALCGITVGGQVLAQVPMTNYCGTTRGICMIPGSGPAGYPCHCGYDQGQLVIPPNMGTVCGTQFGMCAVLPMYLGAPCGCGGPIGRVIG